MILKGNARSGATELARHLLNSQDNDHVELYDVRGLMSDDVFKALREMECHAQAGRCKNFLYSVSLNPPQEANPSDRDFHDALTALETKLGLLDVSRVVVFHEKEGRRHAHAVYNRVRADGKAVGLHWDRPKLMQVSHDLCLKHGWEVPKGIQAYVDKQYGKDKPQQRERFEKEQERRTGIAKDVHAVLVKEAIERSDGCLKTLTEALDGHGYSLCQGKRSFVLWDRHEQETYSLYRLAGMKGKAIKERFGDGKGLPTLDEVKAKAKELPPEDRKQSNLIDLAKVRNAKASLAHDEDLALLRFRQRNERGNVRQLTPLRRERLIRECQDLRLSPEKTKERLQAFDQSVEQRKQGMMEKHLKQRRVLDVATHKQDRQHTASANLVKARMSKAQRQQLATVIAEERHSTPENKAPATNHVDKVVPLRAIQANRWKTLSKEQAQEAKAYWDKIKKENRQFYEREAKTNQPIACMTKDAEKRLKLVLSSSRVKDKTVPQGLLSGLMNAHVNEGLHERSRQNRLDLRRRVVDSGGGRMKQTHDAQRQALKEQHKQEWQAKPKKRDDPEQSH